jgi:hypothetical protein
MRWKPSVNSCCASAVAGFGMVAASDIVVSHNLYKRARYPCAVSLKSD